MTAGLRTQRPIAIKRQGFALAAAAAIALVLAPPIAHAADAPIDLASDTLSAYSADDASHVMVSLDNPSAPVTVQLASFRTNAPDDAAATDAAASDAAASDDSAIAGGDVLQTGVASWYGRAWKGRRTASGTRFNPEEMTAASHTLPLGTRVLVTLEGTARSVMVTITDHQGTAHRVIDLSLAAARKIGMVGMGTARVILRKV